MHTSARSHRLVAQSLAALLLIACAAPAWAGMVGTDRVLERAGADTARAELMALFEREAVQAQLQAQGVSPEQAGARVARMTDAEVLRLHGRIEALPAGGIDILGAAVVVFVVFIVTDALGATDLFTFVEPIK